MSRWNGPYPPPPDLRKAGLGADAKIYQRQADDGSGHLTAIVAREGGRWHLSLSHRSNILSPANGAPLSGRLPTYDELKGARYDLLPDEIYAAEIFPPREEFVNLHPTTRHLWEVRDVRR